MSIATVGSIVPYLSLVPCFVLIVTNISSTHGKAGSFGCKATESSKRKKSVVHGLSQPNVEMNGVIRDNPK